jgi:TonB family protein
MKIYIISILVHLLAATLILMAGEEQHAKHEKKETIIVSADIIEIKEEEKINKSKNIIVKNKNSGITNKIIKKHEKNEKIDKSEKIIEDKIIIETLEMNKKEAVAIIPLKEEVVEQAEEPENIEIIKVAEETVNIINSGNTTDKITIEKNDKKAVINTGVYNNKESCATKGKKEEIKPIKTIPQNQYEKGLKYKILKADEPEYPSKAKRLRVRTEVRVKVKFKVNLKGYVEEIELLSPKDALGFATEVEKAIKKWQFSEINFNGESSEFYFVKEFVFKNL